MKGSIVSKHIDDALKGWEHEPGSVQARLVRGNDGRQVIQMRVELGILQLEMAGRPDGARPHDCPTYFAYLRREAPYEGAARPGLILLDLNLPRLDGREVLAVIKADADLRRIPVVVLTTSSADEDIVRSYDLHANAYVTKPVDFPQFVAAIRKIDDFFLTVVRLPPH